MSHVVKYRKLIAESELELTPEATEIYEAYLADGRIEEFDTVSTMAGTYAYMRFVDSATADAYFAELDAIGEREATGANRSEFERYDEE